MSADRVDLHEPYVDAEQQHRADMMGAYVFLGTEIMLFGGLFLVIYALRGLHTAAFVAASHKMHVWIGGANTALLLTSSLFVALAVARARAGETRAQSRWLLAAAALGCAFLILKGIEYGLEYQDGLLPVGPHQQFADAVERLFMDVYLVATGLHALHLTIGIVLVLMFACWPGQGLPGVSARPVRTEVLGLYWHFVDVVWIFLYPALYLAR